MKNLCHLPRSSAGFLWFGVFTILALAGCKQNGHTSDPRLRQIDEMLDSQLPSGAARSRVTFYLSSQNFPVEDTRDQHQIVATVHYLFHNSLQPPASPTT